MNVYDQILAHKSVRKFKKNPVSKETLTKILSAACRAPSGSNLQNYSIIVTKNTERKNTLADIHFQTILIESAPIVLTFCADLNRIKTWCKVKGEDINFYNEWGQYLSLADTWLAVQNSILAASSLGLGSCLIGSTFHRSIALTDFFELPAGVLPVATLVLGYPDEDKEQKPRLPLEAVIHEEKYKQFDDAELVALYEDKAARLWENYTSIPKFVDDLKEKGVTSLEQLYGKIKFDNKNTVVHSRNRVKSIVAQFPEEEEEYDY